MAKLLTRLKNARNDQVVEAVCREMLEQFGGFDGFVSGWADYQRTAMRHGGLAAYRCFESTIRLLRYCEEKRWQQDVMNGIRRRP